MAAKLPKVHAKMEAMHCDMTIVATDWFICLFATALPSEVPPGPCAGRFNKLKRKKYKRGKN